MSQVRILPHQQVWRKVMDLLDKIEEKVEEYYSLIRSDYHKDHDCHFEIVARWSYGEFVGWEPRHSGYLHRIESNTFKTFKEAAECLLEHLSEMVDEEKQAQIVAKKIEELKIGDIVKIVWHPLSKYRGATDNHRFEVVGIDKTFIGLNDLDEPSDEALWVTSDEIESLMKDERRET